ncbi:MAG: hydroxylamine reductase [Candidatus Cloacimonetes bacterium 4572_55]|nr:MAG: hydroxylamine reductase [Candidatus Cloacimonetes bacterium 4572_55]
MFCFQCQETLKNIGCNVKKGMCGKPSDISDYQDLLIYVLKGLSIWGERARSLGIRNKQADIFVIEGLFSTITNANFDPEAITEFINQGFSYRDQYKELFLKAYSEKTGQSFDEDVHDAATFEMDPENYLQKAADVGILATENEDIRSLRELLIYGIKGAAAYADHAYVLNQENLDVTDFMQKGLAATLDDSLTMADLIGLVMECGRISVDVMALLDRANTDAYGIPEITEVNTGLSPEPGILVSGHDLLDLEELLKQSQGKGIKVYTHGEMLPANAYPELKKYTHLAGNFGSAWYNQAKEFEKFSGPIVMTTNCLIPPKKSYKDRLYTTGVVGWPNMKHIAKNAGGSKDFSQVIEQALACGNLDEQKGDKLTIGFHHQTVLSLAGPIIEAIKGGDIKRFVVMAGCDGRHKEREYFTDVAKKLPQSAVILTAGCAKYRYNTLDLGDIKGIPRILDAGQCNDSYSLAVIALKLKEAFGLDDINDLPISYDIAWYEQKAVCVLLGLLYLGVKGIRLGPTLPAFLSPNVINVLVENFDIKPTGEAQADVDAIMAGA